MSVIDAEDRALTDGRVSRAEGVDSVHFRGDSPEVLFARACNL